MPTDSEPDGIDQIQAELASAVGLLAIEFGRLELDVAELTAAALGKSDISTRDAINAVLSFRQKLDLVAALTSTRLADPAQIEEVQTCVQKLAHFEEERNGLLHAFWAFVRDEGESVPGIFVRAKARVHRKKGLTDHTKHVPAAKIRELAAEIAHFRRLFGMNGSLYHSADLLFNSGRVRGGA